MKVYDLVISSSLGKDFDFIRDNVKVSRITKSDNLTKDEIYKIVKNGLRNQEIELTDDQKLIVESIGESMEYDEQNVIELNKALGALRFVGLWINLFQLPETVDHNDPSGILFYIEKVNSRISDAPGFSEALFSEYDPDTAFSASDMMTDNVDLIVGDKTIIQDIVGVEKYKSTSEALRKRAIPFFDSDLIRIYRNFGYEPLILQ